MPCSDGGPTYQQQQEEQARRDVMARLACAYCHNQESKGLPIPEWAKKWWKEHKAFDEAREQAEQAEALGHKQKQKALAKPTKADREALGL